MLIRVLSLFARALLRWRYRIRCEGLEAISTKGDRGILFLPNHPALIDPPLVLSLLAPRFQPRTVADRDQVSRPFIRHIASLVGTYTIPDPARATPEERAAIETAWRQCIDDLRRGGNVLIYPAGHLCRSHLEELGANSAVETILRELPEIRVVLVRTRGLWGSAFSRASGKAPDLARIIPRCLMAILANGFFFTPRRTVTLTFHEPADLPRTAGRAPLNRYLEAWYNQAPDSHTAVPYFFWQGRKPRFLPEPQRPVIEGDLSSVPDATAKIILQHLGELTGRKTIRAEDTLSGDLGLDSLARVDLALWIEKEFGFPINSEDVLRTVADVQLAACGQIAVEPEEIPPPPPLWELAPLDQPTLIPTGTTFPAVFLAQARQGANRPIVADRTSGVRSYRDLITAIFLLKPWIEKIEGDHIGVMLPASVGATTLILAIQFAGKIPVMVNWTTGSRPMAHALDLLHVRSVLTSPRLIQRLEQTGGTFDRALSGRFIMIDDLRKTFSLWRKARASLLSRISWRSLDRARIADSAVVIFTSGSESLPKAVPLSHANILANMRDIAQVFTFRPGDRVIGILPPFHSFGFTCTWALPLALGIRILYHPNPMEGAALAQLIERYGITLLLGTPTFLTGILRAARDEQIRSLRAVVAGAEKCPDTLYDEVKRRLPQLALIEGYGISECSPVVALNDEHCPRRGSIGKPLPSVHCAIINLETGKRSSPGEIGMLLVRGPSIFNGYLNYDGPSPFIPFEGHAWYRTGDLVSADGKGVLTFAGRLKRFIKIGGEMISLPAIEEIIVRHLIQPGDEGPIAAVTSTPQENNPEITLFSIRSVDRETANTWLREAGLSPLHNIRIIRIVESIPTLGTGKTDYRALQGLLPPSP